MQVEEISPYNSNSHTVPAMAAFLLGHLTGIQTQYLGCSSMVFLGGYPLSRSHGVASMESATMQQQQCNESNESLEERDHESYSGARKWDE